MDTGKLLAELRAEIARLQKVADLLDDSGSKRKGKKGKRKPMSRASRALIAAAQRKRWAKVRKESKAA